MKEHNDNYSKEFYKKWNITVNIILNFLMTNKVDFNLLKSNNKQLKILKTKIINHIMLLNQNFFTMAYFSVYHQFYIQWIKMLKIG